MKGQIRVEFIFGVVIFSVIIFMMISQVNTIFSSVGRDSISDAAKTRAIAFLDVILRDSGDPSNWETNPVNVRRVGLTFNNQPFNLTLEKINKLNSTRTSLNRCSLLEDLGLGGYRMTIYKGSTLVLNCGIRVVTPYIVSVSRPVFIENEYGTVNIEVL